MTNPVPSSWRDEFVVRHARSGEDAATRRAIESGELVRVIRGVYLPRASYERRSARDRHRDLAYAHELLDPGRLTFSHATAASLWGLPRIGAWPGVAQVSDRIATGGRSVAGLARHGVGFDDTDMVDGLHVTALSSTVVDVACADGFLVGVAAADAALRGLPALGDKVISVTSETLTEIVSRRSGARGVARARAVATFADGRAGSPGESLSRVKMHELGIPDPDLQYRIVDEHGEMFVDFCWAAERVVGEFDGVAKYVREEFTGGRSPADVVIAEKRREDRLRRLGWTVLRWGWDDAMQPNRMRAILAAGGIRPR